jgi:hypothetical protein
VVKRSALIVPQRPRPSVVCWWRAATP